MAKEMKLEAKSNEAAAPAIPLTVLILWIFGGTAYAAIVLLFTPFTHNLDDLKVSLQYVLGPITWAFFAVALYCGYIRRVHPLIVFSLSAYVLVYLASTIFAEFPWRAWRDFLYLLTTMTPFLVVTGTTTNERRFRNMCLFYVLVGFATVVFGLFHYFGGVGLIFSIAYPRYPEVVEPSPLFTLLYTLRQYGEMLSTILNRDFYSAFLIMVLPLNVAMVIDYKPLWAKIFFLMSFTLGCICIILAFSKDSYVALAMILGIFLAFYAMRHDWRSVPQRLWPIWIAGGIVILATALFVIREKFTMLDSTVNASIMSRKVIWGGSWKIFLDFTRPLGEWLKFFLIGGGGGAFYLMFPMYRHPDYNLYMISHITIFSHNQYLDLTAEQGILGFITFMTFLGAIAWLLAREAWRRFRHPLNVYQIMLLSSLIGVSFQNIFSPGIRWTVCGFAYYYLLGLATNAFYLPLPDEEKRRFQQFYDFPPALKKTVVTAFLIFTLVFMAIGVPYGLTYFIASKYNNDGLIELNTFGDRCDAIPRNPQLAQDPHFIQSTRDLGLKTIQLFRKTLSWQPDFITAYYKLAHVYSRMAAVTTTNTVEAMKWWRRARATYDELATYAPNYSEIHQNYGILGRVFYSTTSDPQYLVESLVRFHRAAKMSNRYSVQNTYFDMLQQAAYEVSTTSTRQAEIVRAIEPVLHDLNPPDKRDAFLESHLALLREQVNKGDIRGAAMTEAEILREMAFQVFRRLPSLTNNEGRDGDQILRRALFYVADYCPPRGRHAEAVPALAMLLEEDPTDPQLIRNFTICCMRAGQPRQCLELLARLIQRNPTNWAARDAAREVLELIGDYTRSLDQSLALVQIVKWTKQRYPEMFSGANAATLRAQMGGLPSLAEAYYRVAVASEKCRMDQQAYEYYRRAAEEDPNDAWGQKAKEALLRYLHTLPQTSPTTPAAPAIPAKP